MKRLWTGLFLAYVAALAVGTVDQVFLDSAIFPPALDRQLLGMLDILATPDPKDADEARREAGLARKKLAAIRLEQEPSELEKRLGTFRDGGASLDEGLKILGEARSQAVANLVDNDEFAVTICIRGLDPDLALKLWAPGCDTPRVKEGCLEALKKISGQDFGDDTKQWKGWQKKFMDDRLRPAPPPPAAPPAAAPTAASPVPTAGSAPPTAVPGIPVPDAKP